MSSWPLRSADIHVIKLTKTEGTCVWMYVLASPNFIHVWLFTLMYFGCIAPSVHACLHFACVHSCTSVRVQFCPSTSVSVWRWGSACLRVVLAGCPALRGDKWMSVVVVQRADTQTAAHTWLIVSLLGLGPVWLWLGQGLPPTPACVCVWGRVRERQCWKTKRARGRKNVSSYFMSLSVTVLSY